ncbi:MAG: IPT/TIG domain-containing protein [Bacteroidales bacterium]|nr:IPT/TIG domain-containing protein [Bacteroidales bacterium]
MKKIKINTKMRFILFLSLITIIGILWSCEQEGVEKFWNDNEPAIITAITPQSSFVGSEVTISGEYFSSKANNSVSFGGMDANITHANLTEITVEIPGVTPGAAVDVVVTSDGKVSNSLTYTTGIPIIPVLSSIDPSTGKVGSSVVITGTNFGATISDNVVKFNGAEAVVTEVTLTSITATVPAGATTGDVTVTVDGESNGLPFTVVESLTLVVPLSSDFDDAEEGGLNGAMALESSDLELGEYDTWTQTDPNTGLDVEQGVQVIGVRFNNITIPAGATILSATIQFECDATGSEDVELTIFGEKSTNAAPYEDHPALYNISNRTKTTASSVWSVPPWLNAGDRGLAQRTVDLSGILTEIINQEGWSSGNSISFIMVPSGPSVGYTESSGGREAEADVGDDAAELTIIYDL